MVSPWILHWILTATVKNLSVGLFFGLHLLVMEFFRFPFKLEGVWVRNQFAPPSHFGVHQVGPSPVICYLNLNQNTVYLKKKRGWNLHLVVTFGVHRVAPSPVICYLKLNQNTVYVKKQSLKFAPPSHFGVHWVAPSPVVRYSLNLSQNTVYHTKQRLKI